MKRKFNFGLLAILLETALAVGSVWAQAPKPVISVSVQSLENAAADLVDLTAESKDIQGSMGAVMLQSLVSQGTVKDAIDMTRPVGLFLFPNPEGMKHPFAAAVIPVRDMEKALALVPKSVTQEKLGDWGWKLSWKVGDGESARTDSVFLYPCKDWCFVSQIDAASLKEQANAQTAESLIQTLQTEVAGNDFALSFFVNVVPQALRAHIFGEFMEKMEKCLAEKRGKCFSEKMASVFEAELKKLAESAQRHQYESPISKVTQSYSWDADANCLKSVQRFTGKDSLRHVKTLRRLAEGNETTLANFGTKDSLASFQLNADVKEFASEDVDKLWAMHMENVKEKLFARLDEEKAKAVFGFFEKNSDLFRGIAFNPETEIAGAVYADETRLTLTSARCVPDGYALEKEFQTVAEHMKKKKGENFEKNVLDAKRTEDGAMHIYSANFVPEKPLPEKVNALFDGKVPACLIFTPNAVYWAIGTNALETLKNSIQNETQKAAAPVFSMRIAAQDIVTVASACGKIPAELKEKLTKVGEAEVALQVAPLADGVEVVTEIPAKILEMLVLARDAAEK